MKKLTFPPSPCGTGKSASITEEPSFQLWIAAVRKSDGLVDTALVGKIVFLTLDRAVLHAHANNMEVFEITAKRTKYKNIDYKHIKDNHFMINGRSKKLKENS